LVLLAELYSYVNEVARILGVKMKVLVTGADGFIGSHLVEELVRKDYSVRALCQYNSFGKRGWLDTVPTDILDNVECVFGDVRDCYGVSSAVKGCEKVCHLAALIAIPYSYSNPMSYVDTNVTGTLNVLQSCRDHDVVRLVHTSTSEVYGTAQFVPITELHPINAQSPYAATKAGADQLVRSYFASFGLQSITLRPFNTYGPRQSVRAVIPTILLQIARGANVIQLGSPYTTRDFNFVRDTVRGFRLALESEKADGETINLASNFEVSIIDVVKYVSEIVGREIEISIDSNRVRPALSEVERLWGSNEKALTLLSWEPMYGGHSGFKRGLQETLEWFSDLSNLSAYPKDSYIL